MSLHISLCENQDEPYYHFNGVFYDREGHRQDVTQNANLLTITQPITQRALS